MVNGKAKGGGYEREISKRLSLWWSDDKRDDLIWRSQSSGARATTRRKSGKDTYRQFGDLAPTDPSIEPLFDLFCFELKKGYKPCLLDLIDSRQEETVLEKFINQTFDNWRSSKSLFPVLIFKRNSRTDNILFPTNLIMYLEHFAGSPPDHRSLISFMMQIPCYDNNTISLSVMPLESFFSWIDADKVKMLIDIAKSGKVEEKGE